MTSRRRKAKRVARGIPLREAVAVVHAARRDSDVVITSMGTAREWMMMGPPHPLDIVYIPSAMGHAASLGLGIALAQPKRRVIACMGDGSMLMSMGSLATMAAAQAKNLVVVLFDNGVYEVTGGQPAPTRVDFAAIARASGMVTVKRFRSLGAWKRDVKKVFAEWGPTMAILDVEPVLDAPPPRSPGPTRDRAPAFMAALRR